MMTITYTPESYNQRVQAEWDDFVRSGGEGRFDQPWRTPEELAARKIGDAEKIALTILDKVSVPPVPHLDNWVRQIVENRSYAEPLYDYLRREAPELGPRGYGDIGCLAEALTDGNPACLYEEDRADRKARIWAWQASAIYRLADSVISHRLTGEPDTEATSDIGFGFTITTSLAAAVVEYHQMLCNIYARQIGGV